MEIGFSAARRVLPPSNSAISFSIPSRERQFVFLNAKGAASAFGTSKAVSVGGHFHDGLFGAVRLTAGILVQN
jgi:hypothetical protein